MTRYYITPPPANPVTRLIGALFAILVIVGFFVFGVFVLAGAAVLGLIAWVVFSIRGWWLRKKGVDTPSQAPPGPSSGPSDTIEAEYTVISRNQD